MTAARITLGQAAERLAEERLARAGCRIVARNARTRGPERGEIDLIVLDGSTLVFVEVKAQRDGARLGPERPALAVGPRKQLKLRRLARAWLARGNGVPPHRWLRFDVIGIRIDGAGRRTDYEHIKGAF